MWGICEEIPVQIWSKQRIIPFSCFPSNSQSTSASLRPRWSNTRIVYNHHHSLKSACSCTISLSTVCTVETRTIYLQVQRFMNRQSSRLTKALPALLTFERFLLGVDVSGKQARMNQAGSPRAPQQQLTCTRLKIKDFFAAFLDPQKNLSANRTVVVF